MEQRLSIVTLGVRDLDAARRFYVDGLGWKPTLDLDEVIFIQVGHGLLLGLFPAESLEADIHGNNKAPDTRETASAPPFTLANNVDSEPAVDKALQRAVEAGGTMLKPAQRADFGGYHGYFADPDGFRWEIAHNPGFNVEPDGRVAIVPVES